MLFLDPVTMPHLQYFVAVAVLVRWTWPEPGALEPDVG